MFGLPLAFTSPLVLAGLVTLPIIWYLLKLTPPKPQSETFPPLVILQKLVRREETPAKSPWWITLLRLALVSLLIFAMAGPVWRPQEPLLSKDSNLILIIDDGWASSDFWTELKVKTTAILDELAANNKLVTLLRTTNPHTPDTVNLLPEHVKKILAASTNIAIKPNHKEAALALRNIINSHPNSQIIYMSDGLARNGSDKLAEMLATSNSTQSPVLITPNLSNLLAVSHISNEPQKMTGKIIRADASDKTILQVIGYDNKNIPISRAQTTIGKNELQANFNFLEPVELRNQIVRIEIKSQHHAGAVQLLDDSNRRRIVGLISSHGTDISQPLLSPLYYINRALAPFSDIRESQTANVEESITKLLQQNISALILSDIGNLQSETSNKLQTWVEGGGLLIRFAGPRLAAKPDTSLLPVELLKGDRLIGGALSWEEPKRIAPFEIGSPFNGLTAPQEIKIKRQVMASQNTDIDENTWARLEDGTPLVTAAKQGSGWLVLFHVNSDNNWSNLPLSGTFVEMLRRLINLSLSTAKQELNSKNTVSLPALKILDSTGQLHSPTDQIKPLVLGKTKTPSVTLENPPGTYGTTDGYVALNLLNDGETLTKLDLTNFTEANIRAYSTQTSVDLKAWLFAFAFVLFIADCIAILWFAGAIRVQKVFTKTISVTTAFLVSSIWVLAFSINAPNVNAQTPSTSKKSEVQIDFSATLKARIAYVISNIKEMDDVSQAGLSGLTQFISSRTALVPGEPIGVNIEIDELAFYPILYWPIHAESQIPNAATMARVDAYMKQGGSVLFDTRDQISGALKNGNTQENSKLRQILSSLDIPLLEPVPKEHVLTRSFYLLESFPGRYDGGDLWVERIGTSAEYEDRTNKNSDGVSSILITSNDFAGAWAVDSVGRPMFATIPSNPRQRHYAYRVGVNILMYMMTGNYKADQVHIPALLERLGQ